MQHFLICLTLTVSFCLLLTLFEYWRRRHNYRHCVPLIIFKSDWCVLIDLYPERINDVPNNLMNRVLSDYVFYKMYKTGDMLMSRENLKCKMKERNAELIEKLNVLKSHVYGSINKEEINRIIRRREFTGTIDSPDWSL